MSKPFYLKKIQFSVNTISMSKTVPFQTIQFNISTQFSSVEPTDRALSFWARVDLRATAMKGCSAFTKAPASLEPQHQIV